MKFLSFLFSKQFYKHLLVATIILIVLYFALIISLKIYTHHGKAIQVPDVRGLSEIQAGKMLQLAELRFEVIDSVYSDSIPKGMVADQIPRAGSKVKKNRKLFLILNSTTSRIVAMPDLNDLSVRYAKSILESAGLKLGSTIKVFSEFNNLVIGQHHESVEIDAGTPIEVGSVIDILVASGLSDERTRVPELKGMRLMDAEELIRINGLHPGAVIPDEETSISKDSLWVWKQLPESNSNPIRVGESITMWLSLDSLKYAQTDSIEVK